MPLVLARQYVAALPSPCLTLHISRSGWVCEETYTKTSYSWGECGDRAGTDRLGHRLGHNTSGERQNKHSGFPFQLLVTELDIQVPFWENVLKKGVVAPCPSAVLCSMIEFEQEDLK